MGNLSRSARRACVLTMGLVLMIGGCGPQTGGVEGQVIAVDRVTERVVAGEAVGEGVLSLRAGETLRLVGHVPVGGRDGFRLDVVGTLLVTVNGGGVGIGGGAGGLVFDISDVDDGDDRTISVGLGELIQETIELSGAVLIGVSATGATAYTVKLSAVAETSDAFIARRVVAAPWSGDWLIVTERGVGDVASECVERCGAAILDRSPAGVLRVGIAGDEVVGTLGCVRKCRGVVGVEANDHFSLAAIPNDPLFGRQWPLSMIRASDAWDVTMGRDDVVVAVIDSGVRFDHPDLTGRLLSGFDFVSDAEVSLDGDGRDADATDPGDRPSSDSGSYHGTHISGIIAAATNNLTGVAGITWRTRILPVRAFGLAGLATNFDVSEAIRYAAGLENVSGELPERRADVINLSIARRPDLPEPVCLRMAIEEAAAAGVVIVGAAGNNATDKPNFPSAFEDVIAVGAVGVDENVTDYTNFGAWIDLVSPGGDVDVDMDGDGDNDGVLSTHATGRDETLEPGFGRLEGTSMSAAHVSGVAALVLGVHSELTPAEVRAVLVESARDVGEPGRDDSFGAGILDAGVAVRRAMAERAGGEAIISVSETVVAIGADEDSATIGVGNDGAGVVRVVNVSGDDGGVGWLGVTTVGGAADATIGGVVVRVSRLGLRAGVYDGFVTIETADGNGDRVRVVMTVGDGPVLDEEVVVSIRSLADGEEVGRSIATNRDGFEFAMSGIEAGDYVLMAGTDRDGDGIVCESGDVCGMGLRDGLPRVVTVRAGETVFGRNVAIVGSFSP